MPNPQSSLQASLRTLRLIDRHSRDLPAIENQLRQFATAERGNLSEIARSTKIPLPNLSAWAKGRRNFGTDKLLRVASSLEKILQKSAHAP